jgi:hypothetical protein
MVNLTKITGDGYPKKAIEKTVLRFLGSLTFSHGLQEFWKLCSIRRQGSSAKLLQCVLKYQGRHRTAI